MKKLTLFVAALCATTMAFAATDYSAVYTSNVTMTAGTNGSKAVVIIGETKYDAIKLGTGKKTGLMTIAVPKEKNVIYLHAAAWKGTSCSLKLSTENAGVTFSIDSLALKNNDGIQSSSPFTFNGDVTSDYFFTVKIEGNTAGFTLTVSSCENLFRGVIWGVNADALEAVNATAVALDKNVVELAQYKYITLTATPAPANATDAFTWESDNTDVATVDASGKVIVLAAEGSANITVTSKTTATVTATCVVTAKAADVLTCAQAVEIASNLSENNEIAADGKYVIRGYVTEVPYEYDETNKNMTVWLADVAGADNAFEAYKAVPVAAADQKIKVGDLVEVVGDITKYGTTYETAAGATIRLIKAGPATALENVEALEVYAENGRIYAAEGARIFTVSGIDVTEMNGQLNGIYIVKVGNQATKIAVK